MGVKDKRQGKWTVDNLWIAESQWYQAVLILIAAGGLRRPEDEITKKQVNITDGLKTLRAELRYKRELSLLYNGGGFYSFLDQMEKEHMAKEDGSELNVLRTKDETLVPHGSLREHNSPLVGVNSDSVRVTRSSAAHGVISK
ncbi:hypothetical protein B0H14DRAFT_2582506 [Mycena olivaceomarginata]|nr:hypothetical protein B0H14DRAFT_2582506 [Mycena olivaceomarginata]